MALFTPIPTAPEAPSRNDPDNFRTEADAFVDWLANSLASGLNSIVDIFNNAITSLWSGTSNTSMAIGTGSRSFTVNESLLFFGVGGNVRISDAANPATNYMEGTITAYNGDTGAMTVLVDSVSGSGTISSWVLTPEATAASILDEDDMASNSPALAPSQQSVVAWVTNGVITLTNKVLSSPTINSPTITNPSLSGGTVNPTSLQQGGVQAVTVSGTQTLTNKTLTTPIVNGSQLDATGNEIDMGCDGIGVNIPRQIKVDIGDWNMNSTSTVYVPHGLTLSKIIGIHGMVRNDSDTGHYPIGLYLNSINGPLSIEAIDSANVTIVRLTGSWFDSAMFEATSYNRGWLIIEYLT